MTVLTVEQFKQALPDKVKPSVNQVLIDQINQTLSEPELYEAYRNNLVSYGQVMMEGRFSITDYISAVKYVSYKLMGNTNIDAYSKTFPDRIQRFNLNNVSAKDIASYVTSYNKNKLVNLIMEQCLIPSWVLNQDLYQEALNTQAVLMRNAKSEKVRTDAANSLLSHLKMPETQKVELNVGVKEDSSIQALRDATMALARSQKMALESGAMNAQEVAHSSLVVDAQAVEVNP